MNEALDLARELQRAPDLFPWVVLCIVLFILWKERATIKELVQGIITARKETALYHAQHNELIRNNTAALQNNTAMLQILKQERDTMRSELATHEQLSAERMAHIQTVVNRIDKTTSANKESIKVIEDRTDR